MAREKLGIPVNAKNVVLFFGLIRPYKGLAVLLKAANLLSEDTHLIIAGECYGSWGKYEKIINVSKAKSRIHVFNRFIPDEQLGDFFVAADLVALPYLSASQSGVTATAIQFDLPIVASNVGDLSNSITNGKTGVLVAPDDSKALGEAIEAWFSEEHTGIGEAYAKLKASKSWGEFARQLFED